MLLETRKIKIIGDQSVQLEVKIPREKYFTSDDLSSEPSDVLQNLSEMGWYPIPYQLSTQKFFFKLITQLDNARKD